MAKTSSHYHANCLANIFDGCVPFLNNTKQLLYNHRFHLGSFYFFTYVFLKEGRTWQVTKKGGKFKITCLMCQGTCQNRKRAFAAPKLIFFFLNFFFQTFKLHTQHLLREQKTGRVVFLCSEHFLMIHILSTKEIFNFFHGKSQMSNSITASQQK